MYRVILNSSSRTDLRDIRQYLVRHGSRKTAGDFIRRLADYYKALALAPHRGEARHLQREGIRSIGFEGPVTILFDILEDEKVVEILGFYYGGRSVDHPRH